MLAAVAPIAEGENVTSNVAVFPGEMIAVSVGKLAIANAPPGSEMAETFRSALPLLWMVTVVAAFAPRVI